MPPVAGLWAAALPPLAAAMFASSPYLQTGPVAITSLLTFAALSTRAAPGSDEYLSLGILLALLVGVVRIGLGLARLGFVAHLMSEPMLRGFLPAGAILIAASQVPDVLGTEGGEQILRSAVSAIMSPAAWDLGAIAFAAATLIIIVVGTRLRPFVPSVLLAVASALAVSSLLGYAGATVGPIPAGLPRVSIPPPGEIPGLLVPASVIALVGFAEATSIAKGFGGPARGSWDPNREFIAQGAANVTSGLVGGFPVGGSLSRSALSRDAGAVTRASGAFAGLAVLLFLPFAAVLEPLPTAVLGAIVIAAVVKLIAEVRRTAALWRVSRPQSVIAWSTLVLTLVLAPRVDVAVMIGISLAIGWHLIRELRVEIETEARGSVLEVKPMGVLWFGAADDMRRRITASLAQHPQTTEVRLDLRGLGRIDVSGAYALQALCEELESSSVEVRVCGVPAQAEGVLGRVGLETRTGPDSGRESRPV